MRIVGFEGVSMSKTIIAVLVAFSLSGCTGNLKLISEGKAHTGTYNLANKTMTAEIDGVTFQDSYVFGQTFGITSTVGTASVTNGRRVAYGTAYSTGTTVATSNQGRALLVGTNNKTLRCDIMASGMEGEGLCQDSDGRVYDLIATIK